MKETNLLKTLPSVRGPSWLADWLPAGMAGSLAGWLAGCLCVRVGTAGDKPRSSLLAIRVSGLKNNSPTDAHKSKALNAVSDSTPIFGCGGRGHNFAVMTIQLRATQTRSGVG